MNEEIKEKIRLLSEQLAESPENTDLLLERGRLHFQSGNFAAARNDFAVVCQFVPGQVEAREWIDHIDSIWAFRYKDIYNP